MARLRLQLPEHSRRRHLVDISGSFSCFINLEIIIVTSPLIIQLKKKTASAHPSLDSLQAALHNAQVSSNACAK